MEGLVCGREHHIDVSCIANVSKPWKASIFKTKILPRSFYLYLKTSLRQDGGYSGQYLSRLLPEYM
jgi:hypothetical protein